MRWASNSSIRLLTAMGRRCDRSHGPRVEGRLTRGSQEYPSALAHAFAGAVREHARAVNPGSFAARRAISRHVLVKMTNRSPVCDVFYVDACGDEVEWAPVIQDITQIDARARRSSGSSLMTTPSWSGSSLWCHGRSSGSRSPDSPSPGDTHAISHGCIGDA